MNIKQICDKYELLNYDDIIEIYNKEPMVTVAMLSFRRYHKLIPALQRHLENKTPMNLVLRVQCAEELTQQQRDNIKSLVSQFPGHDLQFTEKNLGSGIPRHDVMNRAINDFNTPYIMTTDDDMMWKKYCIETQISLLERMPEYGLISSTCDPNYPIQRIYDNKISIIKNDNIFTDADLIGSATSIYRREIFNTCEYDKEYRIGCGDYDLCMQIRKNGWKIGVMDISELKSLNDASNSGQGYFRERYNKQIIQRSVKRFKEKWGINIR
jgi:GT2 family glycosyltransferase